MLFVGQGREGLCVCVRACVGVCVKVGDECSLVGLMGPAQHRKESDCPGAGEK